MKGQILPSSFITAVRKSILQQLHNTANKTCLSHISKGYKGKWEAIKAAKTVNSLD